MSKRIKDEIAAFKRQNGNANFTVKEMLMYTMSKVDKMNDKLEEGSGKIAVNRESITMIKWVFGAIAVIITVVSAVT